MNSANTHTHTVRARPTMQGARTRVPLADARPLCSKRCVTDRRALVEQRALGGDDGGHVALGVDRLVVSTRGGLVRADVDFLRVELETGGVSGDEGRRTARGGTAEREESSTQEAVRTLYMWPAVAARRCACTEQRACKPGLGGCPGPCRFLGSTPTRTWGAKAPPCPRAGGGRGDGATTARARD